MWESLREARYWEGEGVSLGSQKVSGEGAGGGQRGSQLTDPGGAGAFLAGKSQTFLLKGQEGRGASRLWKMRNGGLRQGYWGGRGRDWVEDQGCLFPQAYPRVTQLRLHCPTPGQASQACPTAGSQDPQMTQGSVGTVRLGSQDGRINGLGTSLGLVGDFEHPRSRRRG